MNISGWLGLIFKKVEGWWVNFIKMLPNILLAAIVLVLFYFIGKLFRKLWFRIFHKISGKNTISGFLATLIYIFILFLGFFIALNILNLDNAVTSLLAGASIIGLAVGFAFQDLTANFISGAYIAFRKPFEVGDLIETNNFIGTVEEINLRSTTIRTFAGLHVLLPNREIFQKPIINYSRTPERKIELMFILPQNANLPDIKDKVLKKLSEIKYLLESRPPEFYYVSSEGNNVKAELSVWINNHQLPGFQTARDEVLLTVMNLLKEMGIVH